MKAERFVSCGVLSLGAPNLVKTAISSSSKKKKKTKADCGKFMWYIINILIWLWTSMFPKSRSVPVKKKSNVAFSFKPYPTFRFQRKNLTVFGWQQEVVSGQMFGRSLSNALVRSRSERVMVWLRQALVSSTTRMRLDRLEGQAISTR